MVRTALATVVLLAACGGGTRSQPGQTVENRSSGPAEPAPGPAAQPQDPTADAEARTAQAIQEADDAKARVEKLMGDLDALDVRVSAAVSEVVDAQSDAQRSTATSRLKMLQKEKAELEMMIARARSDAERAERAKGTKISKECIDNPLAKGCS
jgi:hypothetical protein